MFEFMEIRGAPTWMRRVGDTWIVLITGLLIARFLIGVTPVIHTVWSELGWDRLCRRPVAMPTMFEARARRQKTCAPPP
jgi:hypothetical protein